MVFNLASDLSYNCFENPPTACDSDTTRSTSVCSNLQSGEFCFIDEVFYAKNFVDGCYGCDPDTDMTGWSPFSDTPCDLGDTCTVDDVCQEGQCTPGTVDDGYCWIYDTCVSNQTVNEDYPCLICSPATNQEDWSAVEDYCWIENTCFNSSDFPSSDVTCVVLLCCMFDSLRV